MSLSPQSCPGNPKLLDRVRDAVRLKHYSIRTEKTYSDWIRRFILFHGKRHPAEMAEPEVTAFVTIQDYRTFFIRIRRELRLRAARLAGNI